MVDVLKICGLDQPHVEIGHVGVFRELARDANLSIDVAGLWKPSRYKQ